LKLVLVATAEYLRTNGEPEHLNELKVHRLLTVARRPWGVTWNFEQGGKRIELPIRPTIAANDPLLIVDAVRGGFGIARIAQLLIEPDLQAGSLRKVLPEWTPAGSVDITLLYLSGRCSIPRCGCFWISFATDLPQRWPLKQNDEVSTPSFLHVV
jgi:DNA-binding transcriptional LysR family regulator